MFLIGTPKGMNNIFYDYYNKAQADDNWFLFKAKASSTKIVDQEELDAHESRLDLVQKSGSCLWR